VDDAPTVNTIPFGWQIDWLQHLLDEGYWTCGLYQRGAGREINRSPRGVGSTAQEAIAAAVAGLGLIAPKPPHPSLPRILPSMTRAEAKAEIDKLEAETAAAFAEVQAAVLREREGAAALARIKIREAGR